MQSNNNSMFVIKRNGNKERVQFDKITERITKLIKRDEKKKRKAEWKKACSDDPESKACKEGKPSEKIKNVLKKIDYDD